MKKDPKIFYDNLMNDKKNHFTFFTKDTRFNVNKILKKKNIFKYFDDCIKKYIKNDDKILDFGCGPGTFSIKLSNMTNNEVHGIDISEAFIDQCFKSKKELDVKNFYPQFVENSKLPFKNDSFDIILLFDVIHHLDDIDTNFDEIKRVLKKNGKIIIYEPNKLNPLIFFLHLIDPIERGLLNLGTKTKYFKILKKHNFDIIDFKYNGIVVGPNLKILDLISELLNKNIIFNFLGWLNPKLLLVAQKI